jgi:hypothetical protein
MIKGWGMKKILTILAQSAFFTGLMFAAPALAQAATLTLSPASGSHAVDATFEVKIQLDTGGVATDGTDAYMRFDPTVFQVVDANASATGTQILAGTLYSLTSLNAVDNGAGTIRFSGARTGASTGYSGSGTLATITFKAIKAATSSPVTFDFTAGSTNLSDTNVIQNSDSTDVLTSVTNGSYSVTGGSAADDDDSGSSDTTDTDGDGIPDSEDTDNTGSQGGGSGDVASSGIDLGGYTAATLASLGGAGYFFSRSRTRRPKKNAK